MSRIRIAAGVALPIFALLASTVVAQVFQSGNPDGRTTSTQGSATEGRDIPTCQASGGGTRTRANCEGPKSEATVVLPQQQIKIPIRAARPSMQCNATATTEYQQRNTIARVTSSLAITDCTAASGSFKFSVRVRDESGEIKPLEFDETFARSTAENVSFTSEYPIGENTELVSVRVRDLRCTCADAEAEEAETATAESAP